MSQERGGFVHGRAGITLMRGRGFIMAKPQREQDGGDSFPAMTDSSIKQQYRTAFCTLKHMRSSCKPAIYMDSGLSFDASSEVYGWEDMALAVGSGTFGHPVAFLLIIYY